MSAFSDDAGGAVIFPQLSGLNWPSHVLQAWLTLRALGVPEANLRFVPDLGHVAQPEIIDADPDDDPDSDEPEPASLRHPRGPRYDAATDRVTVQRVDDPTLLRPRLTVNVRSETILRPGLPDGDDGDEMVEVQVGRLAHFLEPLLADLPGLAEGDAAARPGEKPLARMTRQVCARYPELMATIPEEVRAALGALAEGLEAALAETESDEARRLAGEALEVLARAEPDFLAAGYEAFLRMAAGLPAYQEQPDPGALARFREWADVLFLPEHNERRGATEARIAALAPDEAREQQRLFEHLQSALGYETPRERARVVRHLLEILTTEAFSAVAAMDHLWGIGWIHGSMRDFGLPTAAGHAAAGRSAPRSAPTFEALLLSFTGGFGSRTLLLALAQQWAESGGFLGADDSDLAVFDDSEQAELWSLATWRRDAGDPLVLLEIAARRLIHPGVEVVWTGTVAAVSEVGTLWAQLGRTAVLGGKARLLCPGVEIRIPLAEDADAAARVAESKLRLLVRLFLPVTLRVELVWQEAVARLGHDGEGGAYLRHPFQSSVRLSVSGPR